MDLERQEARASHMISQPVAAAGSVAPRAVMPIYSVEAQLRRRRLQRIVVTIILVLLDALMVNVAVVAAYFTRFQLFRDVVFINGFVVVPFEGFRPLQILVTAGLIITLYLKGLYRLRAAANWFKQVSVVASATTIAFTVFFAYDYIVADTDIAVDPRARSVVVFSWVTIIVTISLARLVVVGGARALFRRGIGLTNLLVVGSGRQGKLVMQQIAALPQLGYRIVGFIHDLDGPLTDFGRFKALGTMRELDAVIRGYRIADVIIALPSHQHQQVLRTMRLCERAGANFRLIPDLYELSLSRIDVDAIEGLPLIGLRRSLTSGWQRGVKRGFDIVVSGGILFLGAPIWLLLMIAIKLDSPGPVLYKQARTGYRGETFSFLKFRSMRMDAEQTLDQLRQQQEEQNTDDRIFKDRQDPRRTRVGRFIRKTSLDEIPQLVNVLRGEMSLVGPRPLPVYEAESFETWERARQEVPPGITGLWQVRGRSDITFDEMVLMDLYYVKNWSLRFDLQILVQTIPAVLLSRGAY